jgi:hypothetical protein
MIDRDELRRQIRAAEAELEPKLCAKCGELKLRTEFGKESRSKDGLYCYCKVCAKELTAAYRATPEGREAIRAYLATPEGREKARAATRAWYATPEGRAASARYSIEYQRGKRQAIPSWSDQPEQKAASNAFYEQLIEFKIHGIKVAQDHFIPLNGEKPKDGGLPMSGLDCPDNWQIITYRANSSKGNNTMHVNDEPVAPNPAYWQYREETNND